MNSLSQDLKPRVWITGAGGLIGHYLWELAPAAVPAWDVWGVTRDQLDLADFSAVRAAFKRRPPTIIIHCAAISRSTVCQSQPDLAWKMNVDVTRMLADLAKDIDFVFFSTDLVFDGRLGRYQESDPVHPLSIYAETKVAAEKIVFGNPAHLVIRTSLNGGRSPTGDRGFNEEMRRAWAAGNTLRLFTDEFRSPIPAVVTAQATWELVKTRQTGLFHIAGRQRLSRWEIGQLMAQRCPEL
ncbi:MAG TPA: SDR family oxidoreductase, partial [Verrucomicrobiota bacterium]|nr:SDR family oxidoreductase [Verrucomicrobiota bacterium]